MTASGTALWRRTRDLVLGCRQLHAGYTVGKQISQEGCQKDSHFSVDVHFCQEFINCISENRSAIAMEKQLAPRVVIPPWASRTAWNSSTMIPRILVTHGPNKIAPSPFRSCGNSFRSLTESSGKKVQTQRHRSARGSSMFSCLPLTPF